MLLIVFKIPFLVKPNNTNNKLDHLNIRIQKLESDRDSTLEYMENEMKNFHQDSINDDILHNRSEVDISKVDVAVQTLLCQENSSDFQSRGQEPIKVEIGVQTVSETSCALQESDETLSKKIAELTKQLTALQDENECLRHDVKVGLEDKVFYETFYMENAQKVADISYPTIKYLPSCLKSPVDNQTKGVTFKNPISEEKIIDSADHICFTSSCNSHHHSSKDVSMETVSTRSDNLSSKINDGSFDIPEVCDKTAVNACDESVTVCDDINNNNISCDKFVIGCDKTSTKTCDPSVINTSDKSDDKNVSCDMTRGICAIDYNVKKSFDDASFKNSHDSFDNMG